MSVVENLFHQYEDFQLKIPRWEISDVGVTALSGASGSGKTTIFRILLGLEPCPGLKWTYRDLDLASIPLPEKHVGVVFQSLELFPHMTADENILFAARARRLDKQITRLRLNELKEELRITSFSHRLAMQLSGGEAQRVALARAVITQPRFLFLDEPFSSLDQELKQEARMLVKRVISKLKIPTLLITHDIEDLSVLADHVVKLKDGQLVSAPIRI